MFLRWNDMKMVSCKKLHLFVPVWDENCFETKMKIRIPGSSSSHLKLPRLPDNQKLFSCYLECNTIVQVLYKMFLSHNNPYWIATSPAACYSNYSLCSFTPAQCWPLGLPYLPGQTKPLLREATKISKASGGGRDRVKKNLLSCLNTSRALQVKCM